MIYVYGAAYGKHVERNLSLTNCQGHQRGFHARTSEEDSSFSRRSMPAILPAANMFMQTMREFKNK